MKTIFVLFASVVALLTSSKANAQDTTLTSEAIYSRPYIQIGESKTVVGGYLEGNTNYFAEDGVSEGFSMELRRFNIFLYSAIAPFLKFTSELEFEHGTEEISLETAQLDMELDRALVLRVGILLVPIGGYNQNHDAPRWEFVERPLVATEIIPTTLSEVGAGLHGKLSLGVTTLGYEAYILNGLQDGIILNDAGRTSLEKGKSEEMFGEDNNGSPAIAAKVLLKNRSLGEIGVSGYRGAYNRYKVEGLSVMPRRNLTIAAIDLTTNILGVDIRGEVASTWIDVPEDINEIFGSRQMGWYWEAVAPIGTSRVLSLRDVLFSAAVRLDFVDRNIGTFRSTGGDIFDDETALALGVSARPSGSTVLRLNYRYHWINDILGNPVRSAGFQVGIASYF